MRRYLFLLLIISIVSSPDLSAQNYSLYNGYFLNPFIYNPAAAATERLQIVTDYRRQWVGISGSPTISTLTLSTLVDKTRAGLGFKISSFTRGLLNSTEVSFSYAYGVPLDKTNKLFFGLSGGLLSNALDLNDITDISDPALKTVSNSLVPSGSFGIMLKNSSGFNFGISLPKLIRQENLNSNFSFSYADNIIVMASFSNWNPQEAGKNKGKTHKRNSKKAPNAPLELFSIYRYSIYGSLVEATAKYNFNSSVWLSGTYRQNAGLIPGLGIVTKDVSFGYFYELGIGADLPLKTHEVLLTIQLGKHKKFRDIPPPVIVKKTTPIPVKAAIQPTKPVVKTSEKKLPEPVKKEVIVAPVIAAPIKVDSSAHRARFKRKEIIINAVDSSAEHLEERKQLVAHIEEHAVGAHDDPHEQPVNQRHDFVQKGGHKEELEVTTFVIAGAFKSRENADHYTTTLKGLGYTADFGYLSVRSLWYVFIAENPQIEAAREERNKLQKNKIFKDVWLLTVQE